MSLRMLTLARRVSPSMTRMRVVPRMFSESASRFGGDDKKEVSAVDSIKTKPPAQELVEKFDGDGNRILYEGTQEMTARLMFSASCFNIIYWTYYSVSAYYYQGVVLHGIEMGGDPRWGLAGAFGTGLMLYFTKEFAHHAARQAYETADGKRIGFVMHNILGGRGKKVEVHIGNARIINRKASTFGASLIPVRVKGLGKNVLIDDKGSFYDQDRLFDLLGQGRVTAGESGAGGMLGGDDDEAFPAQIDTKEARLEARKRAYKAGGKKGKKGKKQQF